MILSACKGNQFLSKEKVLCHKNHTINPFFTQNGTLTPPFTRMHKPKRRSAEMKRRNNFFFRRFILRKRRFGLCFAHIGFFDTAAFFVSLPFELFMFSSDLKWKEE